VGIWGDLVKRSKPAPTPKGEPSAVVPPLLPREPVVPTITPQPRGVAFVTPDLAPSEPVASTVVVTSALSRPLVLPTISEVTKTEPETKTRRRTTAPKKLAVVEETPESPLPNKGQMEANLALLLARLKETSPDSTAAHAPMVAAYTPEQVVAFLTSLPSHLSQESRFQRMAEELQQLSDDNAALVADIVESAAAKLVELRRNLSTRQTVFESQTRAEKKQIEQLKAEIARLQAELAAKEHEFQEQRQESLVKVDEMTGVIVFFDSYQAYQVQAQGTPEGEADYVPAYLREDTAERLLGLKDSSEGA